MANWGEKSHYLPFIYLIRGVAKLREAKEINKVALPTEFCVHRPGTYYPL